jgi:hypothetical protein
VAAIQRGLADAALIHPGMRGAYIRDAEVDEVTVGNPMGFFLSVRQVTRENATKEPLRIWQMRAESLHGGYHAMFMKDTGNITAALSFDGWPSPAVQSLAPGLKAAIDACL